MAAPKIYLSFLLIIETLVLELVNSECILEFPKKDDTIPKYKRHFGFEEVVISYNETNAVFYDGERLTAYCANSFNVTMKETEYSDENSTEAEVQVVRDFQWAELQCVGSAFHVQLNNSQYSFNDPLQCKDIYWSIYQDNQHSHRMCGNRSGSFFVGTKLSHDNVVLAQLCYDVRRMELQSISYSMAFSEDHNEMLTSWEKKTKNVTENWSMEITSMERLKRHYIQLKQDLNNTAFRNDWVRLANFQLLHIVPSIPQIHHLTRFQNLFETIWWPNLYYGNWKRVNDALREHVSRFPWNNVIVITGTSDHLAIPQRDPITGNIELVQLKFGKLRQSIPKYYFLIGASHVEDADNFIIFGYNSPFADFYDMSQLIFCQGLCEDLSWLKNIYNTFQYPTMGLVFCCDLKSFYMTEKDSEDSHEYTDDLQEAYKLAYGAVRSLHEVLADT